MDHQQVIAQLLLQVLPLTRDGVALFDVQDHLVYCNATWAKLFGLPSDKAQGMTFAQLIEHNYRHQVGIRIDTNNIDDWLQQANSKRRSQPFRSFESDLVDGRWMMITEQAFNDGYLFCYCSDITEKKKLEQQLTNTSQRLKQLASQDDLTGLDNRRHFRAQASRELDRCRRHGMNATLLALDIDHFKSVNDRLGHAAGDRVLREFSRALREFLRGYDLSGRMGGEEFAVLLPKTNLAQARLTAERLRQMIEKLRVVYQGEVIEITVSIGVATLEQHGESLDELFFVADKYLYLAKETGRNQVIAGKQVRPLQQDDSTGTEPQ